MMLKYTAEERTVSPRERERERERNLRRIT
jgi:hypothetical protein